MSNFIREGGFGMYPVLVFGLFLVALSGWQIFRPTAERLPLIVGAGVATVIAGVLGTATGIRQAAIGIAPLPADQRWLFISGIGEALNCAVLALVLAMIATVLATAGSYRLARARPLAPARA
jgi:hypothetical protein